ncbi:MAG: uroporphyrinogen decarboxylase family protein [Actinobacteria bacterium]|nr:uroporphyrinogen decarboxylase family protein [Actinomycetota bacterium]
MKRGEEKRARVLKTLNHKEGDRVPYGEWYWGAFVNRFRKEKALGETKQSDFFATVDLMEYFDLDLVALMPNIDPHIMDFKIIEETSDHVIVKTGFGSTIKKAFSKPMPVFLDFDIKTIDDLEKLQFDDPYDKRRCYGTTDDMISGVGDGFSYRQTSFKDQVDQYRDNFCLFGGVCEAYEYLWRIIGMDRALMFTAQYPDAILRFNERIADFMISSAKDQFKASGGVFAGFYVYGDVAWKGGMLFSPKLWRQCYYDPLKRICSSIHEMGLKVIYHGCGDARAIFDDLIEAGIDCYNALEAKAGIDVVELKRKYKNRLSYNGNIDVRVLESGNKEEIKKEILHKLNAAKGGGFIPQADHSISGEVSPDSYEYAVELIHEYGKYPLKLGEYDEPI